jgi:TonB family protein
MRWAVLIGLVCLSAAISGSCAAQEAPAAPDATILAGIMWERHPTARDFERHYPTDALRHHIGGDVMLDCLIGADGSVACSVFSEAPTGAGFGPAAIEIARRFRAAPRSVDGTPTPGRRTRIPISFRHGY